MYFNFFLCFYKIQVQTLKCHGVNTNMLICDWHKYLLDLFICNGFTFALSSTVLLKMCEMAVLHQHQASF